MPQSAAPSSRDNGRHGNTSERPQKTTLYKFVIGAIFTALMLSIPWPAIWESRHGEPMADRFFYDGQIAQNHLTSDVFTPDGLLSYITSEYAWGKFFSFLVRDLGFSTEAAFILISAFVVACAVAVVLQRCAPIYLLFLINPLFVDLAFSQLRIAFAMALVSLLYVLRPRSRLVRILVVFAACATHTSVVLIVGLLVLATYLGRKRFLQMPVVQYLGVVFYGVIAAFLMGPWREQVLTGIGDRRAIADYTQSSVQYYLVWAIILLVTSMSWSTISASIAGRFATGMLVASLLSVPLDGYPNRLLAVALPFVTVAVAEIRYHRWVVWLMYLGSTVFYWFYWLRWL